MAKLKTKIAGIAFVFGLGLALPAEAATFASVVGKISKYISGLIQVLIGAGVVLFLYGVVRFIGSAGDEKQAESGKQLMLWGIIALFGMVAMWGLVNFLIGSVFTPADLQTPTLSNQLFPSNP